MAMRASVSWDRRDRHSRDDAGREQVPIRLQIQRLQQNNLFLSDQQGKVKGDREVT